MNEFLTNLSTRRKQAYAALCLAKFCSVKRISHPTINELIEHLLTLPICTDLPGWETTLSQLSLTGLGDTLPSSVEAAIPKELKGTFNNLICCTVEVGMSNMYTASTDDPLKYLLKCTAIITNLGIDPPTVAGAFLPEQDERDNYWGDWGKPVSAAEYNAMLVSYKRIIGES